jgi:anaerobic ribonucleoside-triphosphate reductase activating protein
MNYHNITYPDMNNGSGLRVVLWLSGCSHRCKNCQNQQTWDADSGIVFDETAKKELFNELKKDYISGVTFSGGDPLHKNNLDELLSLIIKIKEKFPSKNIWLYTGFTWEEIFESAYKTRQQIVSKCDVLVDGRYVDELQDISAHWVGSTNQRVIDVQKSLKENKIVLNK